MRNIIIFIIGVMAIAWGGPWLMSLAAPDNPALSSVGISIAALGPVFMAFVLRRVSGQGWSNAGLRFRFGLAKSWYVFSFVYTPVVVLLVAITALALSFAQISPDRPAALVSMFTTFGIVVVPMLLLSVGEEFGWRGYLEPQLWALNGQVLLNHVLVGLIWGAWHFPILIFSPGAETSLAQLLMVLVGCVALAVIYGQMRLWSNSVWPCVFLHAISNATMIAVASSGLLEFNEGIKELISFNTTSVAVTSLWLLTALLMFASLGKKSARRIEEVL